MKPSGDDAATRPVLYLAILVLAGTAALKIYLSVRGRALSSFIPPCIFHRVTGLYCPGCGGTRAVEALMGGRLVEALMFHPAVPYVFFGSLIFALSHLLSRLLPGRIRGMRWRDPYAYTLAALLLLHMVVRSLLAVLGCPAFPA